MILIGFIFQQLMKSINIIRLFYYEKPYIVSSFKLGHYDSSELPFLHLHFTIQDKHQQGLPIDISSHSIVFYALL